MDTGVPEIVVRLNVDGDMSVGAVLEGDVHFHAIAIPSAPNVGHAQLLESLFLLAADGVSGVDDAHDLQYNQLFFLKELLDNLEAPPYGRRLGLCLVYACEYGKVPFRDFLCVPILVGPLRVSGNAERAYPQSARDDSDLRVRAQMPKDRCPIQ